jgi:hypothetical protein
MFRKVRFLMIDNNRWLADGFIVGEQVTPGAPWQIRITDELRARIVQQALPESNSSC